MKIWAWLTLAAAVIGGFFKIKAMGTAEQVAREDKEALRRMKERENVERETEGLSSDDIDRRGRDAGWVRPD